MSAAPGAAGGGAGPSFLMRLARALHAYGTPAHRLENALQTVGRRLGVEGQYLVTPTSIVASIGDPASPQAFLERVEPGGIDLAKLCRLHRLIADLGAGRTDIESARARLTARRALIASSRTRLEPTLAKGWPANGPQQPAQPGA